ncbi:hypothetical protein NI17_013380 [Thermobifida halotolerans]|uniref:Uncharacterized protein n=1 Tax=Thermobifida halotolerans TaxID=483545 RepID=A0A399G156_9ACTN|nr:DUF6315 family protein [Thermobifida halotolerans]UOE22038.1 hypothetical protein NI17_013380 [Thermobifida halotolerans]
MKQELTALCCDCGAIRRVSAHRGIGEAQSAYGAARCVVWRLCRPCGRRTYHAYMRNDADRDELEDALRLDDALAAEALDEEVEQLRLCGVDVGHAPVPAIWDSQPVGMITQRLSDRAYSLVLDPNSSVVARLKLIDLMWCELTTGEHDGRWHIEPPDGDSPGYAVRLFGFGSTH